MQGYGRRGLTESVEGEVEDAVPANGDGEAVLGHWGWRHGGKVSLGGVARARWRQDKAATVSTGRGFGRGRGRPRQGRGVRPIQIARGGEKGIVGGGATG